MSEPVSPQEPNRTDSLHDRIAVAIQTALNSRVFGPIHCGDYLADRIAEAVVAEMDLAIPCDRDGCRMRRISRLGRTTEKQQ